MGVDVSDCIASRGTAAGDQPGESDRKGLWQGDNPHRGQSLPGEMMHGKASPHLGRVSSLRGTVCSCAPTGFLQAVPLSETPWGHKPS